MTYEDFLKQTQTTLESFNKNPSSAFVEDSSECLLCSIQAELDDLKLRKVIRKKRA